MAEAKRGNQKRKGRYKQMTNVQAYEAPKSERTYIKTEYCNNRDSVATEFQCEDLFEVEQLNLEFQKACLALSYFSSAKLLMITCKAIYYHIMQRFDIIFG